MRVPYFIKIEVSMKYFKDKYLKQDAGLSAFLGRMNL